LPQRFRTCFATLATDQYRLLISLFLAQHRELEAEAVTRMLKDAEVYEYVSLNRTYVHRAFDQLPLTGIEQTVLTRALGVKPAVSGRTTRYQQLRMRRAQKALTAPERQELLALENELRRNDEEFAKQSQDLLASIALLSDLPRRKNEEERMLNKLE